MKIDGSIPETETLLRESCALSVLIVSIMDEMKELQNTHIGDFSTCKICRIKLKLAAAAFIRSTLNVSYCKNSVSMCICKRFLGNT